MHFRAYADNVVIILEPEPSRTASGIELVHLAAHRARDSRWALVLASGPGYYKRVDVCQKCGDNRSIFVPNEVRAGDRVLVDAMAGQDYQLDLTTPRHNKPAEFTELVGQKGEFRIIRQDEILCVEVAHDSVAQAETVRHGTGSSESARAFSYRADGAQT